MVDTVTIDQCSLATVHFSAKNDKIKKPGTGFILRRGPEFYLVTALHMLTGRHWETKKPISPSGFLPDRFSFMLPYYKLLEPRRHVISWVGYEIQADTLEQGADEEKAPWLVHPAHREDVDVGLVPLCDLPKKLLAHQIADNKAETASEVYAFDWTIEPKLGTRVGDDVFIVGFPENIKTAGEFPIWKRGSVASEPDVPIGGLPYVLVDTGTRGGMSGAPVIRNATAGLVPLAIGNIVSSLEPVRELFGIYSARFGADDITSQLGIVWKRQVISEILEKPTLGRSSLCARLW